MDKEDLAREGVEVAYSMPMERVGDGAAHAVYERPRADV